MTGSVSDCRLRVGTSGYSYTEWDEPALPGLFPPLAIVTNPDFFYVRFHGRNSAGWRTGSMQKQFDYDYSETELKDWIDLIFN